MHQEDHSDNIIIRTSSNEDVSFIVNCFSSYLEQIEDIEEQELTFSDYNVKLFRLMLIESINIFDIYPAIAEINGKKVGCNFWVKLSSFETKKKIVHALGTFVLNDFRNLGLATRLSEFSFDYLKSKEVEIIYGKVFSSRSTSSKYTKDLGFDKQEILCKML
jgi:hypothetical protein